MLANKLMSALSGGAEDKLYVDSVFSAYTYTGNGATQTINNGIDLAGKGGMVWIKGGTGSNWNYLFHTNTSSTALSSNSTGGFTGATALFANNGFSITGEWATNKSGDPYASWTFRKAPKFFDVVTWTGDGVSSRLIPHALGVIPGWVIVKSTNTARNWCMVYQGMASGQNLYFNTMGAENSHWLLNSLNSSTTFSVRNWDYTAPSGAANVIGETYVAYLFAHDPSPDGIIQCGSYTGNGSITGPVVNLGWEPQYLMIKNASGVGNWQIIDSMRGMPVGSADATLQANLTNAESSVDYVSPTATGFQITSTSSEVNTSGSTYIYLAIRRPNKPPTTGTEVYKGIVKNYTYLDNIDAGFPPDLAIITSRNPRLDQSFIDRLRGESKSLVSTGTSVEGSASSILNRFTSSGVVGGDYYEHYPGSAQMLYHLFRRAPGFFDVVCYTGDGITTRKIPHNLNAVPELIISKARTITNPIDYSNWFVNGSILGFGGNGAMLLNSNGGKSPGAINGATITTFDGNSGGNINISGVSYVSYLFASLPGISKVGSYTGNGTSLTINCGFTTGARFILIKRTNAAGDWYVWDTARGIISANDPHLSLNTTAAEVTTDDSVDPDVSGFIVNQVAATNINVSGASYIFLSIA